MTLMDIGPTVKLKIIRSVLPEIGIMVMLLILIPQQIHLMVPVTKSFPEVFIWVMELMRMPMDIHPLMPMEMI